MAEVDTSVYGNLNRGPDAVEQMQGFMGLLQQVNQNKLFRAQEAAGRAQQQSITDTGEVDPQNLLVRASQDPTAALFMPETIQSAQTQQANKTAIEKSQLELHLSHLKNMREQIAPLLVRADGVSDPAKLRSDILGTLVRLAGSKSLTAQEATTIAASLPKDAAGVKAWLTDHMLKNLATTEQLSTMMGGISAVQVIDPNTGKTTLEPVKTPGLIPAGSDAGLYDMPLDGQAQPQVQQGAQPAPGAGAGAGAPAVKALGSDEVMTGLPTGTAEVLQDSAEAYKELRSANAESPTRITTLQQSLTALDKVPFTNRVADDWNEFRKIVSVLPGAETILGSKRLQAIKDEVTAFDELQKYTAQTISQASSTFAQGTDAKLLQTTLSNPNTKQSKDAMHYLIAGNLAFERMRQAQEVMFNTTGKSPQEFAQWRNSQFNPQIDPRAFAFDVYTPEEKASIKATLKTKEEQEKFVNSIRLAIQSGVLNAASLQ